MTDRVLVGLLDSGVDPGLASHTIAGRAFALAGDGEIEAGPATPDAIGHGSAAARLILAAAPIGLGCDPGLLFGASSGGLLCAARGLGLGAAAGLLLAHRD